jgi:hypothetical protein
VNLEESKQNKRRYLASLALLLLRGVPHRRVRRPARGGASLLRGPVPATGTQGDHDRNPPPHPNKGRGGGQRDDAIAATYSSVSMERRDRRGGNRRLDRREGGAPPAGYPLCS